MKYISLFPYNSNVYLQNRIFTSGVEVGVMISLKKYLQERGIDINTYDIKTSKEPMLYVYFDIPYPWDLQAWKTIISHVGRNILFLWESPLIVPFNYWKPLHIFFEKVYTWHNPLIDHKKYFHFLWPKSVQGLNKKTIPFKKKKFLVMINSNKIPFYPFQLLSSFGKELYSERIKAIDFFERHIPQRFSLYGKGWNKPSKYSLTQHLLGSKIYRTYKGEIEDKIQTLSGYKYCLCFENVGNVDGYITEKIFDCFKARCVPIYWGASDIAKYVPTSCFIDFRNFKDYYKLIEYLDSISEKDYNQFIYNIEELLASKTLRDTWFEDSFAKFFFNQVKTYL